MLVSNRLMTSTHPLVHYGAKTSSAYDWLFEKSQEAREPLGWYSEGTGADEEMY
jgi:hypothetical protein